MRVAAALLCDWANITNDGRINMLGAGIDRVTANAPPTKEQPARGQFMLILRIERDVGEEGPHTVQVLIQAPDGQRIGDLQMQVTMAQPRFYNTIFGMMGVPFTESGPHSLEVLIDGHNITSLPIEVAFRQPG
jgi:hypothetical protein